MVVARGNKGGGQKWRGWWPEVAVVMVMTARVWLGLDDEDERVFWFMKYWEDLSLMIDLSCP